MDSSSGKSRRRSSSQRVKSAAPSNKKSEETKSGSKSKRRVKPSNSFAPAPLPSAETISFPESRRSRPIFRLFLAAFLAVFFLVLLGGSHHPLVLGAALLFPGIAVAVKPPTVGLGKWADIGVLGLIGSLLLAFIPQFYWPSADWRVDAIESFAIDLPGTLSVQPWISFEAWLLALAGFTWLYAAIQWPINPSGRRWLYFFISIIISILASVVIWGNTYNLRYPGAEDATAFSFFPNRNQTANLLALAGVVTFAYAMEGFRYKRALPMIGFPASGLCLAALIMGVSRAGLLLYFIGIGVWFVFQWRTRSMPRLLKIGVPVIIVALSLAISSNERSAQRVLSYVSDDAEVKDEFRLKIFQDTFDMVLDAPLSGVGVGAHAAVFPHYRVESANHQRAVHPESDLFWLASEGGLIAVAFLFMFLYGYHQRCRGFSEGPSGDYRILALVAVLLFLLHGLVDVSGHRPGTAYFAILLAALALPRKEGGEPLRLPPFVWRVLGIVLICFGSSWIAAGLFNLPWHSSVRVSKYQSGINDRIESSEFAEATLLADDWLELRPLDWRAYFRRAQLTLADTGSRSDAAADFRRARFAEPILGVVSYEEGKVWKDYDPARAISAWRETLFREIEGKDRLYRRMLSMSRKARRSAEMMELMARLSDVDPHYRTSYLRYVNGADFVRELEYELAKDPGLARFSQPQRASILRSWIKYGDHTAASEFLTTYAESFENVWWLWSLMYKNQGDFITAIQQVRENAEVPIIPEVEIDPQAMARLTRQYSVAPQDVIKGTALLYIYIKDEDYQKALPVLDALVEARNPPAYIYYWRAECLYQLEEYIDSWAAFEEYFEQIWAEK